jgi:hypothetical protein
MAKGALSEAGQDAYQALKSALVRIVSQQDLEQFEQNPNAEGPNAVTEGLEKAGKAEDPELAKLAQAVVVALNDAGAVAEATGFTLKEVEAANVRLHRIVASGTGVSIEQSRFAGDIEASDVSAGVQPPGKPGR